jgi:hypothetical protein
MTASRPWRDQVYPKLSRLSVELVKSNAKIADATDMRMVPERVIAVCDTALELMEEVADERERCALLCEQRAEITEREAANIRERGKISATTWRWPLFVGQTTTVHPKAERAAKALEASARSFRMLAHGCRVGWDYRVK